jgi:hypothetical protein
VFRTETRTSAWKGKSAITKVVVEDGQRLEQLSNGAECRSLRRRTSGKRREKFVRSGRMNLVPEHNGDGTLVGHEMKV